MKKTHISLLTSGLITLGLALTPTLTQARTVKTAGQATSLCKAQAEKAHTDYLRSKYLKIKSSRGVFKVKMKVITKNETIKTNCEVSKDGTVSYTKV